MKKFIFLNFILLGFIFGCSNNTGEPEDLRVIFLTSDTWKIDLYTHDAIDINTPGINSTQDYLNYVLKFNPNGTIVVTKGSEVINGNWVFKYGNLDTYNQLILTFNSTGVLKNLNKAWNIYGAFPDEFNLRIDFKDFLTLKK